jgi:hypothetical protein
MVSVLFAVAKFAPFRRLCQGNLGDVAQSFVWGILGWLTAEMPDTSIRPPSGALKAKYLKGGGLPALYLANQTFRFYLLKETSLTALHCRSVSEDFQLKSWEPYYFRDELVVNILTLPGSNSSGNCRWLGNANGL